jgi:hypothetical protein
MALFNDIVDDGSEVSDSALIALSATGELQVIANIDDVVFVIDAATADRGRGDVRVTNDTVAVSDALTQVSVARIELVDAIAVVDAIQSHIDRRITVTDAVAVADGLVRQPILALFISLARALTETKVRIDFSAPMLINDALRRPANYVFKNTSPGSAEVVPFAVTVPVGQLNPLYVELDVTEHTEGGTYTVTLSSALRGAADETSTGVPFEYTGIGVKPTLQLVLATSVTEVDVYFSEAITNNAPANDRNNYQWSGGISTVDVKRISGNVVTLQTTAQVPGALYTLTVIGFNHGVENELSLNDDQGGGMELEDELSVGGSFAFSVTVEDDDNGGNPIAVSDSITVALTRSRAVADTVAVTDSIATAKTSNPSLRTFFAAARATPPTSIELQVSVNDTSWTSTNYSPTPGPAKAPRSGGRNPSTGTILIVGDDGLFFRSTDGGATWTLSTPFGTTADLGACWYGNGIWVVNYIDGLTSPNVQVSSDDGVSWGSAINPDSGTGTGPTGTVAAGASDVWFDGCYASGLSLHVGVGYKGSIWTSPNGTAWTRRTAAGSYVGSFYGFRAVTYSPSLNLLVAVGDATNGECQTSPDGTNWTKRNFSTTPAFDTVWDVAWSPTLGIFVAVGEGSSASRIQTSPDGINWTARSSATSNAIYSCTWDSLRSLFVAGGSFGEIQTSPDGTNWTSRSAANTGGNFIGNSNSNCYVIVGGGQAA